VSGTFDEFFKAVKKKEEKKEEKKIIPITAEPKPPTAPVKEEMAEKPAPAPVKEETVQPTRPEPKPITTAPPPPPTQPAEEPKPEIKPVKVKKLAQEVESVETSSLKDRLGAKFEFELKPEPLDMAAPKPVICIYGEKGAGKTWLALSLPGKIVVLDFDGQAKPIAAYFAKNFGKEIYVFDCRKEYTADYDHMTEAGFKVYKYVKEVLSHAAETIKPDWVVFDNTDNYHEILEMAMRYVFNLEPYQGISNRNVWKLRKEYMRELHYLAYRAARRGVVYTCYPDKEEIYESGDIYTIYKKPKWLDIVLYETNVILRVEPSKDYTRRYAVVESSKLPELFQTGTRIDITGVSELSIGGDSA